MHLCQHCRLLRCLCSRSPFQLLTTSFIQLPWLWLSCSGDLSGDFSRVQTSGSLRGPNPDWRVHRRAVPRHFVFPCTHKQMGNPMGTNFLRSQNLHLLDHMVPHSKLHCNFSGCYPLVLSDELEDFCLLHSVAAVLGQPQRGWSAMSVFASLVFHPPSDTAGTHAGHEVTHRWLLLRFLLSQEIQWQHVHEIMSQW
jgi:hypothetical protein